MKNWFVFEKIDKTTCFVLVKNTDESIKKLIYNMF